MQANSNSPIGENIKLLRNQRGITQKALGLSLGFKDSSAAVRIAQYETGVRTPKKALITNIARIFAVDPTVLTAQNPEERMTLLQTLDNLEDLCRFALAEIDRMRSSIC